jgi:hypothetical protein
MHQGGNAMPRLLTIAILVACSIAQAAEPIVPAPGEGRLAFLCRAAYIPQARHCIAHCGETFANRGQEGEQFACVEECAARRLEAMRDCREGDPAHGTSVAVR